MWKIRHLEWNRGKVKPNLPTSFVPRTTGVLSLSGKDAQKTVRPDRRRCQKRLIKKGKMDIKYFEEVQEEHLCLMKPGNYWPYCGTLELDHMMESLAQRIEHGNKKLADEMKIIQEINNFKKTKESYIAPNPHCYQRERISKWDIDQKRAMEHKINIRLDDIEKLKGELIGRKARVRKLKAELEHVRKNISYLSKKLEKVDSKIPRAYKRADELGDRHFGGQRFIFKIGDTRHLSVCCGIQVGHVVPQEFLTQVL
ncbi:putative proton pump-interactor [Helianthus annuus]|nr:putative proton pump-interactor [Helianthus annuus]